MDTKAFVLGAALAVWSGAAVAASVIEKNDRLEVNWSTLRLRFYGEASVGSDQDGYKAAEKRAWHDGLSYASDAVRDLNVANNEAMSPNPETLSEDAKTAARQISQSTFSYNTTYFGDGTVRVHLESLLPKALETSSIRFRQKEASERGMMQYSGILLQADKAVKPRAIYQVVDETGAVLFDVKDMAQEAYRKNLMGRWFKHPNSSELADAVGKNPIPMPVVASGDRFIAKRADWDKALEGHRSLLVNGTIAIALP